MICRPGRLPVVVSLPIVVVTGTAAWLALLVLALS